MKAKALFHIRLRDGPQPEPVECHEFRHLFANSSPARRWRPTRHWLLHVCLLLLVYVLCAWGIRLFV